MSGGDEEEQFGRAFVALRYVCGARDAELAAWLPAGVGPRLLAELQRSSREQRARSLAAALLEVARALEQRRFR